jgi:hypothetical protein
VTDKTKTNRRIERVLSPEKRGPNDFSLYLRGRRAFRYSCYLLQYTDLLLEEQFS